MFSRVKTFAPNHWRLATIFTFFLTIYLIYSVISLLLAGNRSAINGYNWESYINSTEFRRIRPENPAPVPVKPIFECLTASFQDGDSFAAAITWLNLQNTVKSCRASADKSVIAEPFIGDEPKFFIPGPVPSFEYTMMTLGVGHNINAEKQILEKYRKCTRYVAVDPNTEVNEKLVTDLGGHFLQLTVGARDDVSAANILNKEGTRYETSDVAHTSLQNAIDKGGIKDAVDILLIDIEGAEFELLKSFIDKPENHTTICQFNVEIHSPWTNGVHKDDIIHTLYKLSKKRVFLLFNVESIQIGNEVFNRCFFINVKNPYCVKKFYPAFLE